MMRSQPSYGPMALLSTLIAERGYADYDIVMLSPERRYLVRIYGPDGTVAWAFQGTLAELQAMIATVPQR